MALVFVFAGKPREQVQVDPLPVSVRETQPGAHPQPDRDSGEVDTN